MIEFVAGFLAAYGIGAMVLVLYAVREVRKDRKMHEAVRRRIVEDMAKRVDDLTRPVTPSRN